MKNFKYRFLEVSDKLINNGNPYWAIEKNIFFGFWTSYFEEHITNGATFYNKEIAEIWYNYHKDKKTRIKTKILEQI